MVEILFGIIVILLIIIVLLCFKIYYLQKAAKEIADECSFDNRNIKYIDADFDMKELALTIGSRAGVITINDRGFAEKLYNLMGGK